MQLVGVYLVFASLILPALAMAALKFQGFKLKLIIGYVLALLAYLLGITLSHFGDWPASPMIIFSLATLTLLCILVSARCLD